jgi:hypothetical protein
MAGERIPSDRPLSGTELGVQKTVLEGSTRVGESGPSIHEDTGKIRYCLKRGGGGFLVRGCLV